jgi:hypothetical protein
LSQLIGLKNSDLSNISNVPKELLPREKRLTSVTRPTGGNGKKEISETVTLILVEAVVESFGNSRFSGADIDPTSSLFDYGVDSFLGVFICIDEFNDLLTL